MASDTKLGPFCTAIGLTAEILKGNGPFPAVDKNRVTNGLICELVGLGRKRRYSSDRIESWVAGLGFSDENLGNALTQLYFHRDELRRKRKTADIALLEYKPFSPDQWITSADTGPASTIPAEPEPLPPIQVEPEPELPPQEQRELQHNANSLQYEILKREKHLKRLGGKIDTSKDEIIAMKKRKGHFSVRNVNKREGRWADRLEETTEENRQLKAELENLKETILRLKGQKLNLQKKIWKMSELRKDHQQCSSCEYFQKALQEKDEHIRYLESCDFTTNGETRSIVLRNKDGSYKDNVRLLVCELVALEVSTSNIGHVVQSVAKHIFDYNFQEKDLPKKSTCTNIVNEGGEIIKSIIAEKMESTSAWGLHKDGTTRKKQHILDTTVHFATGETYALGFSEVASETGQAIMEEAVEKLSDLQMYASQPDLFMPQIARSLVYFMSDRAANEKKSNALLEDWRNSVLDIRDTADQIPAVHQLFCMAHVLLGFHTYVEKALESHQKNLSLDGSGRLGRHLERDNKFKVLKGASRICLAASNIFAPIGDHMGLRNIWEAFCREKNMKSLITNYKDNRFNGLFCVSAAVSYHLKDFIHLLQQVKEPNNMIKGLLQDLQDTNLVCIINTLGIVFVKITGPFWELITKNHFADVVKPLRSLYVELKTIAENPETFLGETTIQALDTYTNKTLLTAVLGRIEKQAKNVECIQIVISAFLQCMEKQLSNIVSSDTAGSTPAFAPATNLCVERHFGDLDASQHRRPNATLRYHSSFVSLKKHRRLLSPYIAKMVPQHRSVFMVRIRDMARKITKRYRDAHVRVQAANLQKLSGKPAKRRQHGVTKTNLHLLPSQSATISTHMWVAVAYHDGWYPGLVMEVNESTLKINFGYPRKAPGDFGWPDDKDVQDVSRRFIIHIDLTIDLKASGRYFHIKEYKKINEVFQKCQENLFQ